MGDTDTDLYNLRLLHQNQCRHHGLISDNDWHVVWFLTDVITIRDGVASLQFSNSSTLSLHDLNNIVFHLATDCSEQC